MMTQKLDLNSLPKFDMSVQLRTETDITNDLYLEITQGDKDELEEAKTNIKKASELLNRSKI